MYSLVVGRAEMLQNGLVCDVRINAFDETGAVTIAAATAAPSTVRGTRGDGRRRGAEK